MSLDPDRSPDGEPPAPARQAPATERPSASVPTFTPAADDDGAGEPATYYPTTYERAAGEPGATEPAAGEPAAVKPAGEPAVTDAAADEPAASGLTAYGSGAAPAWDARRDGVAEDPAGAGAGPSADLDGPLLSDADALRASWQRIQAAFVDDPREAVADAAGLVEHTAQALAGALRQRQRQLRDLWDRDGMPDGVEYADSGGTAPGAAFPGGNPQAANPDTEQLRRLIQRYRVLFNSLCRP